MADGETKDVTVTMPVEMVDDIDDNLEYGDFRSEWIREAISARLRTEGEYDGD